MQTLKDELTKGRVSHEIFFVCADSRDEVKIKLESFGLSPVYKPIGIEDLSIMVPA